MIYLHTSALLRLIHQDAEGLALGEWLNERCTEVILTSVISEVELTHTLRRTQPDRVPQIPALLAKISTYEVDELVRRVAAGTPDATLSSALHVATALVVLGAQAQAFVTYDPAVARTATLVRLPVVTVPTE